MLTMAISDNGL